MWFFHNSIRFKVNKDWIREFVRIPSSFFIIDALGKNGFFPTLTFFPYIHDFIKCFFREYIAIS